MESEIGSLEISLPPLPSGSVIWENYNEFLFDFEEELKESGFNEKEIQIMNFSEYIYFVKKWIRGDEDTV